MNPRVSAIILTRNRASLLPAAIRSVLNQTYADLELIVVDDASEDNTREVVNGVADARLRYTAHGVNQGEAESRNAGLRNACGEYIAFLDDDDEWLPQKLRQQVELLDRLPAIVGGVYTGLIYIDGAAGRITGYRVPKQRGCIYEAMAHENVLGPLSSVLLRKHCFESVGLFASGIGWGMDYDMAIRLSSRFQFEYIREPLVKYAVHSGQMSADPSQVVRGLESLIARHGSLFALDKPRCIARYREMSRLYWDLQMRGNACKATWKAMKLNPLDWQNYRRMLGLWRASLFSWLRSGRQVGKMTGTEEQQRRL